MFITVCQRSTSGLRYDVVSYVNDRYIKILSISNRHRFFKFVTWKYKTRKSVTSILTHHIRISSITNNSFFSYTTFIAKLLANTWRNSLANVSVQLFDQFLQFFWVGYGFMIFFLIVNIVSDFRYIFFAYWENAITILPFESFFHVRVQIYPSWWGSLQ